MKLVRFKSIHRTQHGSKLETLNSNQKETDRGGKLNLPDEPGLRCQILAYYQNIYSSLTYHISACSKHDRFLIH